MNQSKLPLLTFLVTSFFSTILTHGQIPSAWKVKTTLVPYRKGDKWGYSDRSGKIVISPKWDEAKPFDDDGTALVYQGSVSYFINRAGKVIEPKMVGLDVEEEVSDGIVSTNSSVNRLESNRFSTTYALQEDGSKKWRIYNLKTNKPVTDYEFDGYGGFGESHAGYFIVSKNRLLGVVDSTGVARISHQFNSIEFCDFKDANGKPYFKVAKGEMSYSLKYGVADVNGKIVLPTEYGLFIHYSPAHHLFAAAKNELYGVVNSKNEVVIAHAYQSISFEGDLLRCVKDGKLGFMDLSGNVVIPFLYEDVSSFKDGLTYAKKDGKWGIIDQKNNAVAPFEYEYLSRLKSNTLIAYKGGKYGAINMQGKIILPLIYDNIADLDMYSEYNIKLIHKNGLVGLFEPPAHIISEPLFKEITGVRGTDLFEVNTSDGKTGYIDSSGKKYFED